jgi:hypothetical protein
LFLSRDQVDQIGRIFAQWAIVYVLWADFENIFGGQIFFGD